MDEVAGCLDQRLIRRRLAQISSEIARNSLGSAALHECGETQAALDVAQGIKARSFYGSAGQVNVGYSFVACTPGGVDSLDRFQHPEPPGLMGDDALPKTHSLEWVICAVSRAQLILCRIDQRSQST
jgi:hypothetical protein